jgi:biotin carboxyl carrier protein
MAINRIESLVTGTVWKLERQTGDVLAQGETILIIESMKM